MRFIMLTVLIDVVSIGLIIPVLPGLVGRFTGSQASQAFWYGATTFGFSLANFFAAPVLGGLSDRYGRRSVLLVGFGALTLSFALTALATNLWMLVAVRFFSGAMQSNASVANAYVADISQPEDRARRFGMLGAMFGVGFILGPVVGGLLGAIGPQLPFYAASGLSLLNLLYGWWVLPESLPRERRHALNWSTLNPFTALFELGRLKGVGLLVAVIGCNALAQFILYTIWVLYTTFKFGWGPAQNGWSLFAVGVMAALVQGLLLGPLLKRYSPQRLAVAGLVSSTVSYVAWGASTEGWMMIAVVVVNLLGFTVTAAIQSILSNAADARSQGRILGAASALNSLMAVLAPLFGAPLLAMVSNLPRSDWRVGTPMYFCAALQLVSLILARVHFLGMRHRLLGAAVGASTP
jgi:DHA1 family tetracycline resistance protein-like MFS transporter